MDHKKRSTKTSQFGAPGRVNHDASGFYNSRLYRPYQTGHEKTGPELPFPEAMHNRIVRRSSESMSEIPDNSVHLMITSPPYNVSKEYDADLSLDEYLGLLRRVWQETFRVLVPGGRACINVANLGRKPYLPLTVFITELMLETGFLMRGEIIWDKGASASASTAWGSWRSASNPVLRDVHEYILVFSKGSFSRRLGPEAKKTKQNTITRDEFLEWTKTIWHMNAVSARRIGHPAPFPQELPHRLIQLYSYSGDIVLDPFIGSGTTALAALEGERIFIGYEVLDTYAELAEDRIRHLMKK